jgi:hypothetical protein
MLTSLLVHRIGSSRRSSWTYSLTLAAVCVTTGCGSLTAPDATDAVQITRLSPDHQSAEPGQTLLIAIRVVDANGNPMPDQEVTFSVLKGAGYVMDQAVTSSNGDAGTIWVPAALGDNEIQATVPGARPATFRATVAFSSARYVAGAYTRISPVNSLRTYGGPMGDPITCEIQFSSLALLADGSFRRTEVGRCRYDEWPGEWEHNTSATGFYSISGADIVLRHIYGGWFTDVRGTIDDSSITVTLDDTPWTYANGT